MKKNVIITMYDMEIGGTERSLINMLEVFDYDQYNVDVLVCSHQGEFLHFIPQQAHLLPEIDAYTMFRKSIVQCVKEGKIASSLLRVGSKFVAGVKARKQRSAEGSGYVQMQLVAKYASHILPNIQKQYDVAIGYAWPHCIAANNIQAKKKIAWIHTDFSTLAVDRTLDLQMWEQFDSIASISEECTVAFLKMYPSLQNRMILIENITAPAFIKQMAQERTDIEKKSETAFHLVSVGRLSHAKGFDRAIEALYLLHEKGYTNIKWFVVGYGGDEEMLKQRIAHYGLEEHFVLLGKQTNPYPYIAAGDLYVQPSRYEGKAVTVTEAKILGKPILITNYPTAKSQLQDGLEGIICESSVVGIVEGIEKLYQDEALRTNLCAYVQQQNYSNEEELETLYRVLSS